MANFRTTLLTLSALTAAVSQISTAQADGHGLELVLGAGRTYFEEPLENATHLNLGLGYSINDRWTFEVIASEFSTETEVGSIDVDGRQYRVDALYHLNSINQWRPYVSFGVGDQEREIPLIDEKARDTLWNLGAGAKRSLGNNFDFRTEMRAFTSLDEEYTDIALTVGVNFLFGGRSDSKPVKAAPVAAVAAPAPVAAPEADTDGDGVLDSKDKCPDTPRRYKVDADGCPMQLTETVSINLAVTFDTNSAVVKEDYVSEVKNLADFMNQYADTVVTVEGHTDSSGADAYNKALSQRRADSVKNMLIERMNIEADRVTAIGYGEERPVADNTTAEGRAANRRVVGTVSKKVTSTQLQ